MPADALQPAAVVAAVVSGVAEGARAAERGERALRGLDVRAALSVVAGDRRAALLLRGGIGALRAARGRAVDHAAGVVVAARGHEGSNAREETLGVAERHVERV